MATPLGVPESAMRFLSFSICLIMISSAVAAQDNVAVANLDACELELGAALEPCKVAYVTFGSLNRERDNAVLVPTSLGAKSFRSAPLYVDDGLIDTTQYFVIIVDALANGISSSPSNYGSEFPPITLGDMVASQHQLVTQHFGIDHLHAVVGYSMGGYQALEWAVRFPNFARRIVSIAGTPKPGNYDNLLWGLVLDIVDEGREAGLPEDQIWKQWTRTLWLTTPPARLNEIDPAYLDSLFSSVDGPPDWMKYEDWATQVRAVLRQDLYDGVSKQMIKEVLPSELLLAWSPQDLVVTATPISEFARLVDADTLVVPSKCGHSFPYCEKDIVKERVRAFLAN